MGAAANRILACCTQEETSLAVLIEEGHNVFDTGKDSNDGPVVINEDGVDKLQGDPSIEGPSSSASTCCPFQTLDERRKDAGRRTPGVMRSDPGTESRGVKAEVLASTRRGASTTLVQGDPLAMPQLQRMALDLSGAPGGQPSDPSGSAASKNRAKGLPHGPGGPRAQQQPQPLGPRSSRAEDPSSCWSSKEWQRQWMWEAYYDGSYAPHLEGGAGRLSELPWRSGAPTSQLLRFLEAGRLPAGSRVLDLGCGAGENLVALARHGAFACGVDVVFKAVLACDQALADGGLGLQSAQAVCIDIFELPGAGPPLADGGGWEFDFLFDCQCFSSLRQVDELAAVRIYERLLRPGGRLLLLTGNAEEPEERGPERLTLAELQAAFAGTSLVCEEIQATRFDWTAAYRRHGLPEPPLGWLSVWRKPPGDAEAAPGAGKKQRGAWSMGGKHVHLAPELKEAAVLWEAPAKYTNKGLSDPRGPDMKLSPFVSPELPSSGPRGPDNLDGLSPSPFGGSSDLAHKWLLSGPGPERRTPPPDEVQSPFGGQSEWPTDASPIFWDGHKGQDPMPPQPRLAAPAPVGPQPRLRGSNQVSLAQRWARNLEPTRADGTADQAAGSAPADETAAQGPSVAPSAPEPPTKGSEAGGALAGAPLEEPAPEPQDAGAQRARSRAPEFSFRGSPEETSEAKARGSARGFPLHGELKGPPLKDKYPLLAALTGKTSVGGQRQKATSSPG